MPSLNELLDAARRALRVNQKQLAAALGASERTGERWSAGQARPAEHQFIELARMVFPHDAALAKAMAREAKTTLDELGLVSAAPPKPEIARARRVDIVVCAAAEALDASPRAVRPAVLAAFRAALEIDLAPRDVVDALAEPAAASRRGGR